MENKAYVKDAEAEVGAAGLELPSVAIGGSTSPETRRASADGGRSLGGADHRSPQSSVHAAADASRDRVREAEPEVRQHRKSGAHTVRADVAPTPEADGFPWNASARTGDDVVPNVRSESRDSVSRDSDRSDDSKKPTTCSRKFEWWHKMVTVLQDNRIESTDTQQQLLFLYEIQETHFRMVKRIMNLVFLFLGMILLLAVIVLIIYTDPRFEESVKALTMFMAGRRRGLW